MAQSYPPDHDQILSQILAVAKVAFDKLVALGCAPVPLGRLIVLLRRERLPTIGNREIRFFLQDSHPALLNGMGGRQAKRNLDRAANSIKKLREALLPFAGGRVWRGLQPTEGDLSKSCDCIEAGIGALRARIAESGPQKTPAFEWRVRAIVTYVHETTGGYQDEPLAELLGASSPPGYPKFGSGDALRKWRSERGLVGKPHRDLKA